MLFKLTYLFWTLHILGFSFVVLSLPNTVNAQELQRTNDPVLIVPENLLNLEGKSNQLDEESDNESGETLSEDSQIDSITNHWATMKELPVSIDTYSFKDVVSFSNGDFLAGQLKYWNYSASALEWNYPGSSESFSINQEDITQIRFEPAQADRLSKRPASNALNWQLYLTTGEVLDGELISMSNSILKLKSHLMGELEIPRNYIQSIFPDFSYAEALYRGPTDISDWTKGDVKLEEGDGGQWRYNKNALYATKASSLAKIVNLTPLSSIDIDVAWKGSLNFAIALYTDHLQPIRLADKESEPDFGPFYSLQIGSQSARLQSINKKDPIRQLGYAFIPTLNQKTRARFTVLTDSRSASVTLLVDGKRVHTWRDTQGFFAKGKGIRIVHQGMGSMRIGNLVVRKWNGIINTIGEKTIPYRTDVIQLNNGKSHKGVITSLRQNSIEMTLTSNAQIKTSLKDVHSVHFQATSWKKPTQQNRINLELEFYTSEKLLLKCERLDGTGLFFEHPIFGKRFIPQPTQIRNIKPTFVQ